ncbi:hypothetical protein SAMN04515667_1097 [Formosa sp. Hel1_31_208]|nr:hypothetical protein SAMN04515667_1097 [Formosa sp. Hel1_31_208]
MLMAILVLLSTVSFAVEKHYCGDVLIDVAVFGDVKKCSSEAFETPMKKGCCKDKVEIVKGQDDLKQNTFDTLDTNEQLVLISFVYSYQNLFEVFPKLIIPHKDYSPPNLFADIQVRNQVFII